MTYFSPAALEATSTANYFYINQTMTWPNAQTYCKQQYTNLASVRNATENALIMQLVPYNQMVWIGLYRIPWIWWSDKATSTFRYWASGGHPLFNTGNCASSVINTTLMGMWLENPCTESLNFVCYNSESTSFI